MQGLRSVIQPKQNHGENKLSLKDAAIVRPEVFRVRMNDGMAGRTDGRNIWIDDRLDAIQEKCVIAHEAVHIEMGHSTLQREPVEMAVRYETAKRLLPDMSLGCSGESLKISAQELGVTRQVLMDRAATLTDAQAAKAGCLSCRLCPAIAYRFPAVP